jgi:hypothetical protein
MKCKNLIVLVQTKDNKVFQVGLTKDDMEIVANVIYKLHGGTIKALPKELKEISFIENKTKKAKSR